MAAILKPRHVLSQSEFETHRRTRFAFSDIFKHRPGARVDDALLVGGLLASAICIDYHRALEALEAKAEAVIAEKTKGKAPQSRVCKSGAANICLELFDAAVKCSPIPGLEGVAKIARLIVTAVEEAKVNKSECEDLSKRVANVILVIQDRVGADPDYEEHCKQLETDLEEILQDIEYISSHKKRTSFFRAGEMKERIAHCDKRLADFLQLFHIKSEMILHRTIKKVTEMVQERNQTQTQTQMLTQTNPDAYALPCTACRKGSTDASSHTVRSMVSKIPAFRSHTILLPRVTESERRLPTSSSPLKQPAKVPRRRNGTDDNGDRSSKKQHDDKRTRRDRYSLLLPTRQAIFPDRTSWYGEA